MPWRIRTSLCLMEHPQILNIASTSGQAERTMVPLASPGVRLSMSHAVAVVGFGMTRLVVEAVGAMVESMLGWLLWWKLFGENRIEQNERETGDV